jgi:hypothetical protein
MKARRSSTKVTKTDLERVVGVLRDAGVTIAEVDVTPGRVRLVTTEGRGLTLPGDDAELDRELAEHMRQHGHGQA